MRLLLLFRFCFFRSVFCESIFFFGGEKMSPRPILSRADN
jgi:hypothetical protein